MRKRAKEVYKAAECSAGSLITDSRLHSEHGGYIESLDELAFLEDICLI